MSKQALAHIHNALTAINIDKNNKKDGQVKLTTYVTPTPQHHPRCSHRITSSNNIKVR
jgi:hypothetical protein